MDKAKTIDVTELTAEQELALKAELAWQPHDWTLTPEQYANIIEDHEQESISRCLPEHLKGSIEYAGPAVLKTSLGNIRILLSYLFDESDQDAARDDDGYISDEGRLPWDYEHSGRCEVMGW